MSRYSPSPEDRRYMRSPPKDRYRGGRSPPPRSSVGRRRGTSKDKYSGCLFIGNIPYYFKEKHIRELFYKIGNIETITIGINRNTGQPKGHAFVQFYHYRDAQEALYRFQGNRIDGRALHIDWDAGMRQKRNAYPRRPHHPYDRPRRYSRSPGSLSPESRRYRMKRGSQSPGRRSSRSPHASPHGSPGTRLSRSPTRAHPPTGSPSLKHATLPAGGSPGDRKHDESRSSEGRYRQSEGDNEYHLSPRPRDEPVTTTATILT